MFGLMGGMGLHGESGLVSKHWFESCVASRLSKRLSRTGSRTSFFALDHMGRLPPISRSPNLPAGSCLLFAKHAMLPLAKSMQGLRLKHLIFVLVFPKMRKAISCASCMNPQPSTPRSQDSSVVKQFLSP